MVWLVTRYYICNRLCVAHYSLPVLAVVHIYDWMWNTSCSPVVSKLSFITGRHPVVFSAHITYITYNTLNCNNDVMHRSSSNPEMDIITFLWKIRVHNLCMMWENLLHMCVDNIGFPWVPLQSYLWVFNKNLVYVCCSSICYVNDSLQYNQWSC